MQYPIIDNLIYAYQRNGWTGLELIESKNLIDLTKYIIFEQYDSFDIINGSLISRRFVLMGFIVPVEFNQNYTFSSNITYPEGVTHCLFRIREYSAYPVEWLTDFISQPINVSVQRNPEVTYQVTDENVKYIVCAFYIENAGIVISNIQLEKGTEATPYEPYAPPTTDIFSRTRLPIIRHYPYALIDALQRASTGTQTADDTEVLRHYLTPLGIGGI